MSMAMDGRIGNGGLPRFRFSRRNLPAFLNCLIPAASWRALAANDSRRADARRRWSVKLSLLAWILMGWSGQSAATMRFAEARDVIRRILYRRRRPGSCYQGLVKASREWTPHLLRRLWRGLCAERLSRITDAWRSAAWTVLTVDGSRFDAPRTRSNESMLGSSGRDKAGPQWNVTLLMHLPTCLLWDWRAGRVTDDERGQLREMLDDLPPRTLLVADAGFVGFDLMCELASRDVTFLIRCGSNLRLLTDGSPARIERSGDLCVWHWPENRRFVLPLSLRLIVLSRGGRRMYLLTNELDATRLPRGMARTLYEARWGVEVGYREIKQTLDRRKLLSRSPQSGEAELSAVIVAWGLLRLTACMLLGRRVLRLSAAAALRAIRHGLELIRYDRATGRFFAEMSGAQRDAYERRRSKRARRWPHKKKSRPPGAPELRPMQPSEYARIQRLMNAHPA